MLLKLVLSEYPESFLCKETKIEHHNSPKKELCKTGDKAIWESWFILNMFMFIYRVFYWIIIDFLKNYEKK